MQQIILPNRGPVALSLAGGGSKGAYAVGILKYLIKDLEIRDFRVMLGTSTGALISVGLAAMKATNDEAHFDRLVKIYESVTDKDIFRPNYGLIHRLFGMAGVFLATVVFGGKSLYNTGPLEELVDSFITDKVWDSIVEMGAQATPVEVGFAVTNMQKGQSEIVTNVTHPDRKILREALFASANLPVFMPLKEVYPDHSWQFGDGALLDNNPIERLFEMATTASCKYILSVTLNQGGAPPDFRPLKDTAHTFARAIRIMAESVSDADMKTAQLYNVLLQIKDQVGNPFWDKLLEVLPLEITEHLNLKIRNKNYLPIFHMKPDPPIYMNILKFDQPAMSNLVERGYRDAQARITLR